MFSKEKVTFRQIEPSDIALLYTWLNKPHVHEWYDKEKTHSFDEVQAEYSRYITGEEVMRGYIVLYEDTPVAYMQSYYVIDWPEFAEVIDSRAGTAGMDLYIGEKEFLGIGFGSFMIREFLKRVLFQEEGITTCILDPEPNNIRAIKSYEKVGFIYLKTVLIPGESSPAYLMELRKADFSE